MNLSICLWLACAIPVLAYAQTGDQHKQTADRSPAPGAASAKAELRDPKGKVVGDAVLIETQRGVLLRLNARGLPPGEHAFHIHETGKCEPPDFKSAGGHHNPTSKSHGFYHPQGQHAGDLANIVVGKTGEVRTEKYVEGTKLTGGAAALLDTDGSALVIHARKDDYQTDPAGDAGDRIACGVINRQ